MAGIISLWGREINRKRYKVIFAAMALLQTL